MGLICEMLGDMRGFLGGSVGKESAYNAGDADRCSLIPGWEDPRRAWQLSLVFLPEESHGQKSLVGHSPRCHKKSDTNEATEHPRIGEMNFVDLSAWKEGTPPGSLLD